jgi:hypothetical protein
LRTCLNRKKKKKRKERRKNDRTEQQLLNWAWSYVGGNSLIVPIMSKTVLNFKERHKQLILLAM